MGFTALNELDIFRYMVSLPDLSDKYGLLSVMQGTNAEVFKSIFELYVKPENFVLDCTCGQKRFYRKINLSDYQVIFSDIRSLGNIIADYFHLPFKSNTFDVLIFDPPYAKWKIFNHFNVHGGVSKVYQKDSYNLERSKTFTFSDMKILNSEFAKVLKCDGLLIMKIQDKRLTFAVPSIVHLLGDFKLIDVIVYVFNDAPIWVKVHKKRGKKLNKAYRVHAYFMVFRRV